MKNYILCINALATRTHRRNVDEELSLLKEFYINQTAMTRKGILILLNRIKNNPDYYNIFFEIHHELIKFCIQYNSPGDDVIGEGPYTFFYFIYKNPNQAINVLYYAYQLFYHFEKNTHKVLQYLFCLGDNYVISFNQLDVNHIGNANLLNFMVFFVRRTQNFLSGFAKIQNQLFSQVLPFSISIKSILPTSGDMHCGGKIPYYILSHSEQKFVYKPRDMRTDLLITQTLVFFNNFLEEKFRLPVFQIELLNDNTGIMEFVTHTEDMSQEQAHFYFLKFGVLICFIELFGIGDIHYENVIATEQGPVIVDLECALNPISIKTENIDSSSIGMIKNCFQQKKIENATFTVNGQFYPLDNWRDEIIEGFLTAARCFKENQNAFVQHYFNLFQEPLFCRIVPMKTGDFYTFMYAVIYSNKEMIENMLQAIFSNISDFLKKIWGIGEDFLDKDFVCQSIYNNFFYGDVPFLQLGINIIDGHAYYILYINGVPFSQTIKRPLATLEIEFRNQINWLNSSKAEASITRFIG